MKHLQGVVNNLVYSWVHHPQNYNGFWYVIQQKGEDLSFEIDLLNVSGFPVEFSVEEQESLQRYVDEYRQFFKQHLDHRNVKTDKIVSAKVNIESFKAKEGFYDCKLTVMVKSDDGKTYEAESNVGNWYESDE